jgi:hypothetical protein
MDTPIGTKFVVSRRKNFYTCLSKEEFTTDILKAYGAKSFLAALDFAVEIEGTVLKVWSDGYTKPIVSFER